jgi:hypothetical protein
MASATTSPPSGCAQQSEAARSPGARHRELSDAALHAGLSWQRDRTTATARPAVRIDIEPTHFVAALSDSLSQRCCWCASPARSIALCAR